MRDPLPRFLLPTVDMKKAIERNAKQDENLSTALKQLDQERRVALCHFWDKKDAFIKETAKRTINLRLRRKISVEELEPDLRNQKNSFYAASEKNISSLQLQSPRASQRQREVTPKQAPTVKNNTVVEILENGAVISKKTTQQDNTKASLATQANNIDRLPSLNVNNYYNVQQIGKSKSRMPRRISFAAVPTPRDPSVTRQKRRRATVHNL